MAKYDWLYQRSRGVHLTIRDIDCINFDAKSLAKDLHELNVNVLTFFCAGYVTVHPTELSIRQSPYLGNQDITGDIIRELREYDIRAVPAMDLSLIPANAAQGHPEWRSLDHNGQPYKANADLGDFYIACPLSGYQNEYLSLILQEILTRYDVDGIKFGGGSYGFSSYGNGICHCDRCKAAYRAYADNDIPLKNDWNDPEWGVFQRWRQQRVVDRSKFLYDLVKSLQPGLPVMCNSVAFGDPVWTTQGALDIERMAEYIDAVQVEAQTRVRADGDQYHWDFLMMPAEEANFLSSVSNHQTWVLASYFQAWPWRRNAVPPEEQKVYMAQIYANGGNAILNLSGGPPKVHDDHRGFPAVTSLFAFVKHNQAYYENDRSAANIAIVYSQDTLFYYGRDDAKARYVEAIRGFEQALTDFHIPFDIISDRMLQSDKLKAYQTVILPSMACMSENNALTLRAYVADGGNLIATFETSLFDTFGKKRDNFLLADLFGSAYIGTESVMGLDNAVYKQAYMNINKVNNSDSSHYINDINHPLLNNLGHTRVIPASNQFCQIKPNDKVSVSLTLSAPFRVFPEGMSYTEQPDTGFPMATTIEHEASGRVVYFPGQPDTAYMRVGYPDWALLMVNAVKWTLRDRLLFETDAPSTLMMTIRQQEGRRLIHMVNLNGGRRMFSKLIPARDVKVTIPITDEFQPKRVYLLSNHQALPLVMELNSVSVVINEVRDYDVIVFEEF